MKLIMVMASTVDGRIAKSSDHRVDWTSKEDKQYFVKTTKEHGVVIMGRATYDTIGRPLPGRLNIVLTREKRDDIPGTLEHFSGSPRELVASLEKRGYASAVLAGGANVNGQFIKDGLVSEIHLTLEPTLFGKGIGVVEGVDVDVNLALERVERLNERGAVLLVYSVKNT